MLNKTSKLDAVNTLLSSINQSPINNLTQTTVDVTRALQILDKTSREVQTNGWKFNTEDCYQLVPNTKGNIFVPDNVLLIDLDPLKYSRREYNVTLRGNQLYNLATQSFMFPTTLKAIAVLALDWEQLPQHARTYIVQKAQREFYNKSMGVDATNQVASGDELQAYIQFKRLESNTTHSNYLDSIAKRYGGWRGIS